MFNERASLFSASERLYFAEEFAVNGETDMLLQGRTPSLYIQCNKYTENTY